MGPSVRTVYDLVSDISALDEVEADHRGDTLRWLERTDDVFRRAKPATPDRHLVAYTAIVDQVDGSTLLVDHVLSGLNLPPGGHVEPDEHPAETARREVREELGIEARFLATPPRPAFLTVTVTVTVGTDAAHTDVSLWFVLAGSRTMPLVADPSEFRGVRWWTPEEFRSADPGTFDPHYGRFLAKIGLGG